MQWFLPFYPKFVAWGLPYHGIARDKTLTTTVGEKAVELPKKPYAGEVVLVQHSEYKPVVDDADYFTDAQKAYHTANGIEWRQYAFLCGRNRMLGGTELYPIPDPPGGDQPTVKQWVYCDEHYAWLVGIEVVDYGTGRIWYDVEVTLRGRLVFTAGPDQEEIEPRRLALERIAFLDSKGDNSSTSALANPSLVLTHSRDGAKTAGNVFLMNCYQDNLDTLYASPEVSHAATSPYPENRFTDVFGSYASFKVEISGNGDKDSAILGDGITATLTVHKVCSSMIEDKEAEASYDYVIETSLMPEGENLAPISVTRASMAGAYQFNRFEAAELECDEGNCDFSLTWRHSAGRTIPGNYYGGWISPPSTVGETYWELETTAYLYVTPDGVYHDGVTFDGWSGYKQTISEYTADGAGPLIFRSGGPNSGEFQVVKAMSYTFGSESTLTVFGETFGQSNLYDLAWEDATEWSTAIPPYPQEWPFYLEGATSYTFNALQTTVHSETEAYTSSGEAPESYAWPVAVAGRPLRIGWYIGIHTPTIIDVFYYAKDRYFSGGQYLSQPIVYVTSVAVDGTRFNRYLGGEYRRASYNPVTGAIVIAADDEQHICHV